MIKKLFPFLSVIMLALFVGACSSEDVMPDIDQGASSRTVTFEALMPGSGATTRVVAEELADRSIDLTWETGDEIVLLFVQGTVEENATAKIVTTDGESGTFTVTLPTGISETEDYTIYGAYGTAGAPTEGNTIVNLPSTDDLGDKILLHFEKAVTGNAIGSVEFAHTGYVFTAKVEITGGTVSDINLVADSDWAISSSNYQFNLKTGDFTTSATATNAIALENFAVKDGIATARSWFPATETELPALKLSVNGTVETADAKPARTPEVGKAYYLYATWDGTDLVFADKDFNVPQTGTKISIADFRALAVKGETYSEDKFIEGEVILNPSLENVTNFIAYVADESAGLTIAFTDAENVLSKMPLGAKVKINVQNSEWDEYKGLIQLKLSTDNVEIVEATNSTPLVPRVVTIQDILDGKHQSELVQVNNVQFKDVPTTYNGGKKLVNIENEEITVFTRSQAAFAGNNVIEGNGPFIGVVSHHTSGAQLLIRSLDDLAGMTGIRVEPPFMNVNPTLLSFEKEAGSETIAVTSNVSWTASSNAAWATVSPASGANNGTITVNAQPNTGADARNAVITITGSGITETVAVVQAGTVAPSTDLLFPGADFDNWTTFLSSLSTHGLTFGKESTTGGIDGSGAMQLEGNPGSSTAYVFTAVVPEGFSAEGKTKITFWVKGTATKSLSLNVYTGTGNTMGTDYKTFNMDEYVPYNSHQVLEPKNSNSYAKGGIDTGEEWIKVSLNISTLDINTTPGQNLFALKVGGKADYDLFVDDITIE